MKKLILTAACLVGMGLVQVANALSITPTSGVLNTTRWEGNEVDEPAVVAAIQPYIGTATFLYKANVGDDDDPATTEEGSLAGSYNTTFSNEPLDPADATVTYIGGPIVGPVAYGLVKDGAQTPAWYLFNLTALGWNGTDTLDFSGFWPGKGAISHISLYGTQGSVPDGGMTAVLLGLGMVGLGVMARRKA